MMRNICLGKILELKTGKTVKNHLVYVDFDDPKPGTTSYKIKYEELKEKLLNHIIEKDRLIFHSYKEIIDIAKNTVELIDIFDYSIWQNLEKWIDAKIDRI